MEAAANIAVNFRQRAKLRRAADARVEGWLISLKGLSKERVLDQ